MYVSLVVAVALSVAVAVAVCGFVCICVCAASADVHGSPRGEVDEHGGAARPVHGHLQGVGGGGGHAGTPT